MDMTSEQNDAKINSHLDKIEECTDAKVYRCNAKRQTIKYLFRACVENMNGDTDDESTALEDLDEIQGLVEMESQENTGPIIIVIER